MEIKKAREMKRQLIKDMLSMLESSAKEHEGINEKLAEEIIANIKDLIKESKETNLYMRDMLRAKVQDFTQETSLVVNRIDFNPLFMHEFGDRFPYFGGYGFIDIDFKF